jgi:hypothetical protein
MWPLQMTPVMDTAMNALSMTQKDGRRGQVRYVVHRWSGDAQNPGSFAIVRWVPASIFGNPFPPAGLNLPVGVTITTPLPADSPRFFG